MFCKNCGREINDGVTFCPYCGVAVSQENTSEPSAAGMEQPYTNPQQVTYEQTPYSQQPQNTGVDGFAIASLVLGIASFIIIPLIGAILAIVFGNISKRNRGANTMARVGKILGIVALVLWIVIVFVYAFLIVAMLS